MELTLKRLIPAPRLCDVFSQCRLLDLKDELGVFSGGPAEGNCLHAYPNISPGHENAVAGLVQQRRGIEERAATPLRNAGKPNTDKIITAHALHQTSTGSAVAIA